MEPRIAEKDAFTVIGLEMTGTYEEMDRIPILWDTLIPRAGEVQFLDTWGVSWDREQDFTYIASFEVCDPSRIPDGMVLREVAAQRYAVFTHQGKVENLHGTFQYAYKTWLPENGLERNFAVPFLELYDERWQGNTDESSFEIWLPLK
ncbi:AraC family transcriptional regulator [Tumebacillus sp. BK434]|uniref:GyrI-like domain-containing protein n=1 Tax=Tumebacillus sp. BK434 TaxID=2512169 RepID=UPI001049FCFA|nr:GyrI-like domain-containing protein [Tumebacillus sp. BK434]TCP59073.1 AraC family transcriptional regulator [Tumebacillus sp. BK434]